MKNRYIPKEIKKYVWVNKDKKLYLWRRTYNNFKDTYSLFSSKEFVQIVKFLLNAYSTESVSVNDNFDYHEDIDSLERKWISILEKEFGEYLSDEEGYSKIIFFLALLENIHCQTITQNKIYLSFYERYNSFWWKFKPKSLKTIPNFYKIIITLKDSVFYKIQLVDNAPSEFPSPKNRIWDRQTALNYIDYSFLDEELFDLMYRDSFSKKLRQLIAIYTNKF